MNIQESTRFSSAANVFGVAANQEDAQTSASIVARETRRVMTDTFNVPTQAPRIRVGRRYFFVTVVLDEIPEQFHYRGIESIVDKAARQIALDIKDASEAPIERGRVYLRFYLNIYENKAARL